MQQTFVTHPSSQPYPTLLAGDHSQQGHLLSQRTNADFTKKTLSDLSSSSKRTMQSVGYLIVIMGKNKKNASECSFVR